MSTGRKSDKALKNPRATRIFLFCFPEILLKYKHTQTFIRHTMAHEGISKSL